MGDYEVEYFSNTLQGSFPEFVFENLVVDKFLEIKLQVTIDEEYFSFSFTAYFFSFLTVTSCLTCSFLSFCFYFFLSFFD